jgi:hypothetical protein
MYSNAKPNSGTLVGAATVCSARRVLARQTERSGSLHVCRRTNMLRVRAFTRPGCSCEVQCWLPALVIGSLDPQPPCTLVLHRHIRICTPTLYMILSFGKLSSDLVPVMLFESAELCLLLVGFLWADRRKTSFAVHSGRASFATGC